MNGFTRTRTMGIDSGRRHFLGKAGSCREEVLVNKYEVESVDSIGKGT